MKKQAIEVSSRAEEDDHDTTEQQEDKRLEVVSFEDICVGYFLVIELKASSGRKFQFLARVMWIEGRKEVSFLRNVQGGTSTEDAKFIFFLGPCDVRHSNRPDDRSCFR